MSRGNQKVQPLCLFSPAAECPANSHSTHRMTRCEPSCANPNPKGKCTRDTQTGCVCNEGFLLSEDKCVPRAQCGCSDRKRKPTQPSSKALSVLLVSCVVCPARLYQCYLWRVSCVNSNTTTLQRDCMTALRCVHAGPHNLPELAIIQIEACSTHARCVLQNGQRMYHCRKPYHGD
ncbi:hypothetical protein RRG08_053712 [Elysia crispata]|uniref:TIL domain-containing protein n=1 Tax=Elysia crispata TaxID=231223 RepID=A0AAE0XXL9_9GAST|nr:hypothetical protein RRG08_053712 [Elysia crispata]